jgi:small GTP-binding protein
MKILLLGDAGVGKTSFIRALMNGDFITKYIPTYEYHKYSLIINKNTYTFIDTCGQHKNCEYSSIIQDNHIDYVIIMYDINSLISFKNINLWEKHIPKNIPFLIIGNKSDIKNIIDSHYISISTKRLSNIDNVITTLHTL